MAELQQELFTGTGMPDGTVAVNARCLVRTEAVSPPVTVGTNITDITEHQGPTFGGLWRRPA